MAGYRGAQANRGKVKPFLMGHVAYAGADCLIWPFSKVKELEPANG